MTPYVSGQGAGEGFPADREGGLRRLQPARSIMQDGQPSLADDFNCRRRQSLRRAARCRSSRGDRATALRQSQLAGPHRDRGAPALFGTDDVARPDPDPDRPRQDAPTIAVTGVIAGPARRTATSSSAWSPASIRTAFFADAAELPHQLGQPGRLVSMSGFAPGADAETINRQLPAWEKRNIPDRCRRARADQSPATTQDWQLANVRDIHLGEAQAGAMTPGQRPAHHRHLRDRRPADPRHGLRQLHQPRHRPRQRSARARWRCARCSARAASS